MGQEGHTSRIESVIQRLNRDTYLLATISAVPFVGGSITQIITGIGQEIVQERNKRLFEQLAEHLQAAREEAIRKDYFESPEGLDLLIRALEVSGKTRSEVKRDLIARILTGALSTDAGLSEYAHEEYLNMVASLTPKELEVARSIYDSQKDLSPQELDSDNRWDVWRLQAEMLREKHALDESDLTLLMNRLYSVGLVDLVYVLVPGSPLSTYWVSRTFRKLMRFLQS
jgi:hypothetical protein